MGSVPSSPFPDVPLIVAVLQIGVLRQAECTVCDFLVGGLAPDNTVVGTGLKLYDHPLMWATVR